MAAGVPLQLLLAVLTVKVVLTGRAQVHWAWQAHNRVRVGDRHSRPAPGSEPPGQVAQQAEAGPSEFLRASHQNKVLVCDGRTQEPALLDCWGLVSHLKPEWQVSLNRVKSPRGAFLTHAAPEDLPLAKCHPPPASPG